MHHIPDWLAMMGSSCIVVICSLVLNMPGMDQMTIYMVFLGQIFFLGLAFNGAFVILESRTNPKLLSVAFELDFSLGCGSTMFMPVLAKSPPPIPSIIFVTFGFFVVASLIKIGPRKQ